MAQRSPNLYGIDRFSHTQRPRQTARKRRQTDGVERLRLGGKRKRCFYFYVLTLLKNGKKKTSRQERLSQSPLL